MTFLPRGLRADFQCGPRTDADREQAIETLKDAFVHGRLAKDELDTRAGRALTA